MDRIDFPMLSWPDVKVIIEDGALEKLGRSADQQCKYVEFRDNLQINWETVTDYLLVSKMDFAKELAENGKMRAVRPSTIEIRTILSRNDFSYNFESDIDHFVLWKVGSSLTSDEVLTAAHDIVKELNAVDFVTYINPPHLKSILDIEHAHILLKL